MAGALKLPFVDLLSPDRAATARSIREACSEFGFFYLVNHGIERQVFDQVFRESKRFFSLPLDEKMKSVNDKEYRGYTPFYAEKVDPSPKSKGDSKEMFMIGPEKGSKSLVDANRWPSEDLEDLPSWRTTMVSYYEKVLVVGMKLVSLIALALNLDEKFFENIGAFHIPTPYLRLLHYAGESTGHGDKYGASAHSDYGMVTLLATDGVPGLQICRQKDRQPQLWEDTPSVDGAFIVNVGDMLERWTNCLFRSTLHRVLLVGKERYSAAFFLDPNYDCLVECLESCCSETCPSRYSSLFLAIGTPCNFHPHWYFHNSALGVGVHLERAALLGISSR